ncbi:hypothetical protein ACFL4E_03910 [Candidatus Omnitrophota bacterium]
MKLILIVCLAAVYAASTASPVYGKGYLSESDMNESCDRIDTSDSEDASSGGKSARYQRVMRDLDREYEAGGLTKTEYIQRKRAIDELDL